MKDRVALGAVLLACGVALTPALARAQTSPNETSDVARFYNADYYSVDFDPKLKAWLVLVDKNHVNDRVWSAFRAGQYSIALDDTKYALERFPNHPRALALMGEIGRAMGQLSPSIAAYELALKLYPQYAFTHAQYGHFLVEIGAPGAGAAELREALRLNPSLVAARAWLDQIESASPPAPADRDSVGSDRTGTGGN